MTDLQKELNSDKSYELLNHTIESLEKKFGECTNVETKKEGRINFKYEVYFCDDNNKITIKKIEVCLSNGYVKVLKR